MSEPPETRDFFLSFTGADRAWAEWIAWTIEEAGYSVWFQHWDFKGNFLLEMDRAHTKSRRTIAVLSPAYLESRFAAPEWAARFAEDGRSENDLLVPVRVQDLKPTGHLAQISYVDLVGVDAGTAKTRLLERLSGIRLKPDEPPIYPTQPGHKAVAREPRFPGMVRAGAKALHHVLIGGGVLAAIVGAFLTWWLTGPTQHGSVTIAASGDVTIPGTVIGQQTIHGVPFEDYKEILAERDITAASLGVTDQALAAFFAIMEEDRVPREALATTLKEIAERYRALLARVEEAPPSPDEAVAALRAQVREALERVDFAAAERLLDEAKALDLAAIDRMGADLEARKLSAAETASEAGDLQMTQLRYTEAVRHYEEAVTLLPASSPERRGDFLNALGVAAWRAGQYDRAVAALEVALAVDENRLAADHSTIGVRLNNLALLYHATGRFAESEPLFERAIAIGEKTLGPEHPELATWLNNLAALYEDTDRFAEAEPLHERALAITEKTLGPEHPELAISLNNLAILYRATGRFAEAEPLSERALAITEKALGPEHPELATSLNNLAGLYEATGRFAEAEPLYERALAITEKTLGPEHPDLAIRLNNLAGLYEATGRFAEAEPLYARAIHIIEASLPADHPSRAVMLDNYAGLLDTLDRPDEAADHRGRARAVRDARAAARR